MNIVLDSKELYGENATQQDLTIKLVKTDWNHRNPRKSPWFRYQDPELEHCAEECEQRSDSFRGFFLPVFHLIGSVLRRFGEHRKL